MAVGFRGVAAVCVVLLVALYTEALPMRKVRVLARGEQRDSASEASWASQTQEVTKKSYWRSKCTVPASVTIKQVVTQCPRPACNDAYGYGPDSGKHSHPEQAVAMAACVTALQTAGCPNACVGQSDRGKPDQVEM